MQAVKAVKAMLNPERYPTWILAPIVLFGIAAALSFALWRSEQAPRFWRDFGGVSFVVSCGVIMTLLLFGWQDNSALAKSRILFGLEQGASSIGKLTADGQRALLLYITDGATPYFPPDDEPEAGVDIGGVRYSESFLLRVLGPERDARGCRYPVLAAVSDFTTRGERAAFQRLRDWLIDQDVAQPYRGNSAAIILEGQDERIAELFGVDIVLWAERN